MAKQINARIITKHDTEANWKKAINFTPAEGEIIIYEADDLKNESRVPRFKVGDGKNKINDLPFSSDPYILKEKGKGLSSNDFNNEYKELLESILKIDITKRDFTNTTYSPGNGIALKGTTFYNTGLLSVELSGNNNILKFQQYNTNTSKIDIKEINLKDALGNVLNNLQDSDNPFITKGTENGTISINGGKNIAIIEGLGELAFRDESWVKDQITQTTGDKEIFIGSPNESNQGQIWIDTTLEDAIIKYRFLETNEYKMVPFLRIEYNWEVPWQIGFITEKQNYTINTGIFSDGVEISENTDLDDYINIGIYSSYSNNISSSLLNTPVTATGFKLIVLKGYENFIKHQLIISFDNNIYYRVLQENQWTNWVKLNNDISTEQKIINITADSWSQSQEEEKYYYNYPNKEDPEAAYIITAAPDSLEEYSKNQIYAKQNEDGSITFIAKSQPEIDILVNCFKIKQPISSTLS